MKKNKHDRIKVVNEIISEIARGYPAEDMEAIRQKAIDLGYLKPREESR